MNHFNTVCRPLIPQLLGKLKKAPPPFGVEKEMVDFHQVVQQELTVFPIAKIAENVYDYLNFFGEIFIYLTRITELTMPNI